MGYYIDAEDIPAKGKATVLIEKYGAVKPNPGDSVPPDKVPVVVIENGPFDAAGIAFDSQELREFLIDGTSRRRTLLLMDRATVIELCPRVQKVLRWPTSA